MGQHVDYTAAPLLDIEVLGAKSPGQVPQQCAGADGGRLACELKCRKNKRPTHVLAGRWCRELLSRGSQVSDIRRCRQLRLGARDEERSDRHESEGKSPLAHTTSRVRRSTCRTNVPGSRNPARDKNGIQKHATGAGRVTRLSGGAYRTGRHGIVAMVPGRGPGRG